MGREVAYLVRDLGCAQAALGSLVRQGSPEVCDGILQVVEASTPL
jgi:hypothetical protein